MPADDNDSTEMTPELEAAAKGVLTAIGDRQHEEGYRKTIALLEERAERAEAARAAGNQPWDRCLDCEGPLVPCTCRPGCPGGQCTQRCGDPRPGPTGSDPAADPQDPGSDPTPDPQGPVACPHPPERISVPVNGRYTCMQCGRDVPRPRRPRRTGAAQPRELIRHRLGSANCDPGPVMPLLLARHIERCGFALAQAVSRAASAHVFTLPAHTAHTMPAPAPFPDEFFEIGPLMPAQPFRRKLIDNDTTPYIAPPIRVSFCPACNAPQGTRCEGFERWDECHIERVETAALRGLVK